MPAFPCLASIVVCAYTEASHARATVAAVTIPAITFLILNMINLQYCSLYVIPAFFPHLWDKKFSPLDSPHSLYDYIHFISYFRFNVNAFFDFTTILLNFVEMHKKQKSHLCNMALANEKVCELYRYINVHITIYNSDFCF